MTAPAVPTPPRPARAVTGVVPSGPTRASAYVCEAVSCLSIGSQGVLEALAERVAGESMDDVAVKRVGCLGLCASGPLVQVPETGEIFTRVTAESVDPVVNALRVARPEDPRHEAAPFFARQVRIVTERSGLVDPESLEDAVAAGGYEALRHVLTATTPAEVRDEITASGLRGRGGAGYPTGLKWNTVAKAPGSPKVVICNADEGDPGAFMDRSVLESDPHRVLEGMAIAAYAVGASTGYVYCRAEYPLAVARLRKAIREAAKHGYLGANVMDTQFAFEVDVRLGAGAFVCGEETALIASIEGKRGQPRPRPPYPAEEGLWGCPTLINNVETYANVPPILRNGADWYAAIGTEKSKGTKVFALAGKVANTGLIEVPMGITLREIIFEIGGGIPGGHKFKAVQTGGPSGGCIPEQFLDMPVDYESLAKVGSIMGSGGMIVMDDSSCMVDVARFFMDFCKSESCGKCVPCRVGTAQMLDLLQKILDRKATPRDLALLESLCDMVKHTSLCGLGQSAPNPVLTTLTYFRGEYDERIQPETSEAAPTVRHLPMLAEVTS